MAHICTSVSCNRPVLPEGRFDGIHIFSVLTAGNRLRRSRFSFRSGKEDFRPRKQAFRLTGETSIVKERHGYCMTEKKGRRRKKYDVLRFALKCICIPAAAVLILYFMNKSYRKIDSEKYLDVVKFSTLGIYVPEVQIGNLGSSHGAYDFNYDALTERGYQCFNFANTSQSYNYDYAVLKEFGSYLTEDSILFIPVSYFSFNNEVVNDAEREAMSIRYYHCLSPENIPDYEIL